MSKINKDEEIAIGAEDSRNTSQRSGSQDRPTIDSVLIRTNQALKWSLENPVKATGIVVVGLVSLRAAGVRKTLKWLGSSVGTMFLKDVI